MLNLLFKKYEHSWKLFARVVLRPSLIIASIGFVFGIVGGTVGSGLAMIAGPLPLSFLLLVLFISAASAVFLSLPVLVSIYGVLTRDERPLISILLLEVLFLHPLSLISFHRIVEADFGALFNGEYWRLFTEFKILSMLVIIVIFFFIKKYMFSYKVTIGNFKDRATVAVLLSLVIFYFASGIIVKPLIMATSSNPEGTIYYTIDHTSNLYAIDDAGEKLVSDDIPCSIESKYRIIGISPKGRYLVCTNTGWYRRGIIIYDIAKHETKRYDSISLEPRFSYGSNQLLWSPDEKKVIFTYPSAGYLNLDSGKITIVGDSSEQLGPSFDQQGNFYYVNFTTYGPGNKIVYKAVLLKYNDDGTSEKIHSFTMDASGELPYAFSRDGKILVYYSGAMGGYKIMKLDLTNKKEQTVTQKDPELEYDTDLRVSYYDGDNSLYIIRPIKDVQTFPDTLFEVDLNGESRYIVDLKNFEKSFYHYGNGQFFFSPSYSWVAGRNEAGLVILNLETGKRKQLSSGGKKVNEGVIGWV